VGMTLSEYLKKKNMSVNKFAKKIGISQPAVHNWIHGNAFPGKTEHYERIYKATKGLVTPNDFWKVPPIIEETRREVRVGEIDIPRREAIRLEEGNS
jgi:transcriptional regulator with XRE-family HTH domain